MDAPIKWSEIKAEGGSYRDGFVALFHKYEGRLTDEVDASNRPVKVTKASFARHMGINKDTFRNWEVTLDPRVTLAKKEAAERARQEAEARREAEVQRQEEAEAQRQADAQARREAEARAREAEARAREAEARAQEAEDRAQQESEDRASERRAEAALRAQQKAEDERRRRAEQEEKDSRKDSASKAYHDLERSMDKAQDNLRDFINLAHGANLGDLHYTKDDGSVGTVSAVEFLTDSIERTENMLKLARLAIVGTADIDWDSELERIS